MNDTHKETWERAKARAAAVMKMLPGPVRALPPISSGAFAEVRLAPGQAEIDALVDTLVAKQEALGPVFSQVSEIVRSAASYEDMLEKLYALYPSMNTKDFETLLKQAGFAADLWGYVKARGEHA